ncbi:MAG: alpha/beta fold hydrolase [Paracoccaceae bacterium]
MTRELQTARRGPEPGQARQVVVFLHGYGADGRDLLGLADPLEPHMPETAFVAPDAPEKSTANPMGFQWFPIPWLDGSSEETAAQSMVHAVADLNAYLDQVLLQESLTADRMILFGFSQGTMMALHVAPRRDVPVAGVVGFSGRLLEPDRLTPEVVSRPPVLLLHGDQDEMVPPESMPQAAKALRSSGFKVATHDMAGTGHGIAPDGLSVALAFMRENLGLD